MENKTQSLYQQLGIYDDRILNFNEDEIKFRYFEYSFIGYTYYSYSKYMYNESNVNIIHEELDII